MYYFYFIYFDIFGKYVFKNFPSEKQCNCIYSVQSILKRYLYFSNLRQCLYSRLQICALILKYEWIGTCICHIVIPPPHALHIQWQKQSSVCPSFHAGIFQLQSGCLVIVQYWRELFVNTFILGKALNLLKRR